MCRVQSSLWDNANPITLSAIELSLMSKRVSSSSFLHCPPLANLRSSPHLHPLNFRHTVELSSICGDYSGGVAGSLEQIQTCNTLCGVVRRCAGFTLDIEHGYCVLLKSAIKTRHGDKNVCKSFTSSLESEETNQLPAKDQRDNMGVRKLPPAQPSKQSKETVTGVLSALYAPLCCPSNFTESATTHAVLVLTAPAASVSASANPSPVPWVKQPVLDFGSKVASVGSSDNQSSAVLCLLFLGCWFAIVFEANGLSTL